MIVLGLAVALLVAIVVARKAWTAFWTIRALAFTPLVLRRLAPWIRLRSFADEEFFQADGADPATVDRRQRAIERLARHLGERHPRAVAWSDTVRESFSDLRFTDASRVPTPFARFMREHFDLCSVVTASDGPRLKDIDDNWMLDISGAYGLNVAGHARYKTWMARGLERVQELGPVLGPLHPVVADNIAMLRSISNLDEVSFHMSGTEAVMAAVRLARFNTRRKLIVCFSGAYHGWWDGVQSGLGNERSLDDCLTLKDLDPASLDLIRHRAREIAGVLVNPAQAFHPNAPPPNDAVLVTSGVRRTSGAEQDGYARWLQALRAICDEHSVPLIFDEVYSGFRLAPGGMPIGVVCGRKALMRRFDPERPMRIAYVVGTFSAHPVVMGAMNEFLRWLVQPSTTELYDEMNHRCAEWVQATNRRLADADLPIRLANLATVWTVLFTEPGRYNWLLQYYLRAEDVTLSWVGTGRCLSNMDFTDKDYEALQTKLVGAAATMKADGWWLSAEEHPGREKSMRARLAREVIGGIVRWPRPLQTFYEEVMRRKVDDHHASHSNVVNQIFHIVSSSAFLVCYALAFWDLTTAMWAGLAALFLRQIGHAILEPPCHDKEALLLGYNTRNKTMILGAYLVIPAARLFSAGGLTAEALGPAMASAARDLFVLTMSVIGSVTSFTNHTSARRRPCAHTRYATRPATTRSVQKNHCSATVASTALSASMVQAGARTRWTTGMRR